MQLFLFPYAGGSARSFRDWPDALKDCCAAVPVDTPCNSRSFVDEPEALTIHQMAQRQASRLARTKGRFAIFGHSMGALVAFETVRQLRRTGGPMPHLLVLSAHRAPHLSMRREALGTLSDSEFDARLETYCGTPHQVLLNAEMMDIFRPQLRRDFLACETYRYVPEPPLPVPVLCMGGSSDPDIPAEDLSAWSSHFTDVFDIAMLPGGHFYFRDSLAAAALHIKSALGRSSKGLAQVA